MKTVRIGALLGAGVFACASSIISSSLAAGAASSPAGGGILNWPVGVPMTTTGKSIVPGWPAYVAMGAVGGPNVTPPTKTSTGGDDDFGGRPVDVVFKYAGSAGNGDPGMIDPPTNTTRMTGDLTALSSLNSHAMHVAMVEYTAQMSGGFSTADFSNSSKKDPASGGDYLMARHLISLSADAIAMNDEPVVYKNKNYYGTLILNPDLLGSIEQGNDISTVNKALPAKAVDTAVDQALCFLTTKRTYLNTSNPNGVTAPYVNKTYHGTPVQILEQMLADGYPVWSINGATDPYWNTAIDNKLNGTGSNTKVAEWFKSCVASSDYDKTKYKRPNFPAGFDGWVQANNWLIRTFSPVSHVTFGWQDNMWAVSSGFWLHADLTYAQIGDIYSKPVKNWLAKNAPSAITKGDLGASYVPDYFVFDRYETDDSASAGEGTLYNGRSWDNYLSAIEQVTEKFNNIPIMMWQIPGSHIPYTGEKNPELFAGTKGEYVFSSAPVYFFGDSNLKSNLSNIIMGSGDTTNKAVGNYAMSCGNTAYNCAANSNYKSYLLAYQGKQDNYNWGKNRARLAWAAEKAHVFAILWGGGDTTSVIKNFSNTDDHGWLAGKIKAYYKNPTMIPQN